MKTEDLCGVVVLHAFMSSFQHCLPASTVHCFWVDHVANMTQPCHMDHVTSASHTLTQSFSYISKSDTLFMYETLQHR